MIRFDDRVAIVTGAGGGLGRSHALALAERGAKVVVNDLGNSDAVVAEITAAGGTALANAADVSDAVAVQAMVDDVIAKWGRIDIVLNNAGILRDKSFAKMDMADFRKVIDVHLIGSANVTHAAWPHMKAAGYGRVLFTSSSAGLYGNFGQANYGAAKAAMLGLMNVLHHEGAKDNIRVNLLAPTATTQMTKALIPPETHEMLRPEVITPGVLALLSETAPSQMMLGAGGGSYAAIKLYETVGITLDDTDNTPETVAARMAEIDDPKGQAFIPSAFHQTAKYAMAAAKRLGLDLNWTP